MIEGDLKPVLKWAGGKRRLIEAFKPLFPENYNTYYEPFFGGGAVLLHLRPNSAVVGDINPELINVYSVIRDNVSDLIDELSTYENSETFYYSMRNLDRNKQAYNMLSNTDKAARVIYLNKTCFNGLYRVNSKGEFNVPYGKKKSVTIVDKDALKSLSEYLNSGCVNIASRNYNDTVSTAEDGDFVYFDPPYYPMSDTANFTKYAKDDFTKEDQVRLYQQCCELNKKGVKFMLSNSAAPFIRALYSEFNIRIVKVNRGISAKASTRGTVDEVVIRNY